MANSAIPNETATKRTIQRELKNEFAVSYDLLDFAVGLPRAKDFGNSGCPRDTTITAIGVYVKSCLTYRSILCLCELGLARSAMPLSRSLFETALNLAFLTRQRVSLYRFNQNKCKPRTPLDLFGKKLTLEFRTALYNAFCLLREEHLFKQWDWAPGLIRRGKRIRMAAATIPRAYVAAIGSEWEKRLGNANTCAGLSIADFAASLGTQLRKWHRSVYAEDSQSVHQSDVTDYLECDAHTGIVWPKWHTFLDDSRGAMRRAGVVFHGCVGELHKRFRFGPEAQERLSYFADLLRNFGPATTSEVNYGHPI